MFNSQRVTTTNHTHQERTGYPAIVVGAGPEGAPQSWPARTGPRLILHRGILCGMGVQPSYVGLWVKRCLKPSPSHHHFYRLPFPIVMGGLWHCFTHITWLWYLKILGKAPNPRKNAQFSLDSLLGGHFHTPLDKWPALGFCTPLS